MVPAIDYTVTKENEMKLTEMEQRALEALRKSQEQIEVISGEEWGSVYLDNAKPWDWSGKAWSGVLSSLSQKGLYREDEYAFGLVKMSS